MSEKRERRRIHDLDEMQELWPMLYLRLKKRLGTRAASALSGAMPVEFSPEEVVLDFVSPLLYQKALAALEELPFEAVFNDYLDVPRTLRLQLRGRS